MTVRLFSFALLAIYAAPWTGIDKVDASVLGNAVDLLNRLSEEYKALLENLGFGTVSAYFLFFFALVIVQLTFVTTYFVGRTLWFWLDYTSPDRLEFLLRKHAFDKVSGISLSFERARELENGLTGIHEEVSSLWQTRIQTASEIYSVLKGQFLFLLVAIVLLPSAADVAQYVWFIALHFLAIFFSALYFRSVIEGFQKSLVERFTFVFSGKAFVAFSDIEDIPTVDFGNVEHFAVWRKSSRLMAYLPAWLEKEKVLTFFGLGTTNQDEDK